MKRVYELDVYKLTEELWHLRLEIRNWKLETGEIGPKLNAFINSTNA